MTTTDQSFVERMRGAEARASSTDDWIGCAEAWHAQTGRAADADKTRCLKRAEEADEGECPAKLARAWTVLFSCDGECEARRILRDHLRACDTVDSVITASGEIVHALGVNGLLLAQQALRKAEEHAWGSVEWEACAAAWESLPGGVGADHAAWCRDAAMADRAGDLGAFLARSGCE